MLIGPTESGLLANRVYIGETDDLPGRLDSHNKNKEFWNRAIVFTSKDANLNKAHIRYLEARLIGLATVAKRAELDNGNLGSSPPLSEPDTAEAKAFLAEMLDATVDALPEPRPKKPKAAKAKAAGGK